jgi:hypothetical protein
VAVHVGAERSAPRVVGKLPNTFHDREELRLYFNEAALILPTLGDHRPVTMLAVSRQRMCRCYLDGVPTDIPVGDLPED